MPVETTDTLVIGAGQAGLAMSEHLTRAGVPHLVLERDRIAERWRSGRWDSLVANGPAWHDRFPGMTFDEVDPSVGPDDFPHKEVVAAYMEAYARRFRAPVRTGVEVLSVERLAGRGGFRVATSQGVIEAQRVVAATGPFQQPVIPPVIPEDAGIAQMHSSDYRNPGHRAAIGGATSAGGWGSWASGTWPRRSRGPSMSPSPSAARAGARPSISDGSRRTA